MSNEIKIINFPLIVWEGTPEFKVEAQEAQQRMDSVTDALKARGYQTTLDRVMWDFRGYPIVRIPGTGLGRTFLSEALDTAKNWGSCGWWDLEDLEDFKDGGGIIFKTAMFEMGYRPHNSRPTEWASVKSNDKSPALGYSYREKDKDLKEEDFPQVKGADRPRLIALRTEKNIRPNHHGEYYRIGVGSRGMISCELFTPYHYSSDEQQFTDFISDRDVLRYNGHLNMDQEGFKIRANSIDLRMRGDYVSRVVYLQAIRPDQTMVEAVWPTLVHYRTLNKLAENLVSAVV